MLRRRRRIAEMSPRSRRLALAALLCLAAAPGLWWRVAAPYGEPTGNLSIEPLPIELSRSGENGLAVAGAWLLRSDDRRFSGYSALVIQDDGRLRAYSDANWWLEFNPPDRSLAPAARFGVVPGYESRGHNDLEAAAHDAASGVTWLAFENLNSIRRIGPENGDAVSATPPAMAGFRNDGGTETMVRLADGRFVVIAESGEWRRPLRRAALLFARDPVADPRATAFAFNSPAGLDPTDAALLPDGRVLILLRGLAPGGWPPFKSKLLVADPADIRPGAAWPWQEVADLSGLIPRENYEGLAVARGESGLELWLISDANRSVLMQRTLLVKLVWNEPASAGARLRRPAPPS